MILLVTGYVRNEAQLMAQLAEGSRRAGAAAGDLMPAYGRLIRRLADPDRFPALHAVLDSGVLDQDDDPDDEFVFGLDRVLDGVEALVHARSAAV